MHFKDALLDGVCKETYDLKIFTVYINQKNY